MRTALAIALLAIASCSRSEPTTERRQPLEPSGNPVAEVARDRDIHDDRTATRSPNSQSDSPSSDSRSSDDRAPDSRAPASRTRDDARSRGRAPSTTEDASPPSSAPQPSSAPPPPGPASPSSPAHDDARDVQLPPSLLEGNNGGTKDKIGETHDARGDKRDDRSDKRDDKRDDRSDQEAPMKSSDAATRRIAPIRSALCVTTGAAAIGGKIEKPAMRAVAKGTDGDAASMTFIFHGETPTTKKLSSGELRRQIGLKLRAENGCNLIYVMWRLDPRPMVYAQLKRNPGDKDHKACGAGGYKKIKATLDKPPPELRFGEKHTLRAEISSDTLEVFIDGDLHWRGTLPDAARDLRGPAGIRSDNLAFDLVSFDAATTNVTVGNAKCVSEDND